MAENAPLTRYMQAKLLCDLVCSRYGLSEDAIRVARKAAARCPTRAIRCYGAVLRSLGRDKR